MLERVPRGGVWTVNVTALLVPPDEVTVTFLPVGAAPPVIVKFAVTVVEFTAVKLGTVTPEPDTVTAIVPIRLVPVKVTATVVPRTPALGLIEVNVGIRLVPWNSTAPTSKRLGWAGSGLGLPKKSLSGTWMPVIALKGM